jgi:putative intracellular protease/amidase
MDLRLLGWMRGPEPAALAALLRPFAAAGLALAATCGVLMLLAQAGDHARNGWFRLKMARLAAALLNAALHLRTAPPPRHAAARSLALWPAVLLSGRMIGSF